MKWAFKVCDQNGSGRINKTELYTGMLLVYLNLAKYVGPAACYVRVRGRGSRMCAPVLGLGPVRPFRFLP